MTEGKKGRKAGPDELKKLAGEQHAATVKLVVDFRALSKAHQIEHKAFGTLTYEGIVPVERIGEVKQFFAALSSDRLPTSLGG